MKMEETSGEGLQESIRVQELKPLPEYPTGQLLHVLFTC